MAIADDLLSGFWARKLRAPKNIDYFLSTGDRFFGVMPRPELSCFPANESELFVTIACAKNCLRLIANLKQRSTRARKFEP
jgi:hypothetical protein